MSYRPVIDEGVPPLVFPTDSLKGSTFPIFCLNSLLMHLCVLRFLTGRFTLPLALSLCRLLRGIPSGPASDPGRDPDHPFLLSFSVKYKMKKRGSTYQTGDYKVRSFFVRLETQL